MPITVPVAGCVADLESDVVDADHFAAVHVDDLLVEQVPADSQHVLVGMIRREDLFAEADAVERDGVNLVVADAQPGPPAAHQKPVDAGGMHQWNHGGVTDATDPPSSGVEHGETQQFGEEEDRFRHRQRPGT